MSDSATANIGVIGLAVMGSNLARNLARHGHTVVVFNRTQRANARPPRGASARRAHSSGRRPSRSSSPPSSRPRRIIIMVKAGARHRRGHRRARPAPRGRRHRRRRRQRPLRGHPAPRGGPARGTASTSSAPASPAARSARSRDRRSCRAARRSRTRHSGRILESISAKVDGEPCCAYMGPDGAGHFVKMVHNGIEYADMQFIAEAYDVLTAAGLTASDVADVFREWNTGELDSFLVEITAEVLDQVDASTGAAPRRASSSTRPSRRAPAAGPSRSPSSSASRCPRSPRRSSPARPPATPSVREAARGVLTGPERTSPADEHGQTAARRRRPRRAVVRPRWSPTPRASSRSARRARTTAGASTSRRSPGSGAAGASSAPGCSRRSATSTPPGELATLLVAPSIAGRPGRPAGVPGVGWSPPRRRPACRCRASRSALAYYDTVRAERLPAALVQGLRDNFGAHTYRRIDREGTFHTLWSGDRTEVDD